MIIPKRTFCCHKLALILSLASFVCQIHCDWLEKELLQDAEESFGFIQEIRRSIHSHPELMFEEEKTSAYIRSKLDDLNIQYNYPYAKTGIVGKVGDGGSPKFALRADMDALPIQEEVDSNYKSKTPGKMHACGHDAHVAMLLGAAKILKAREADLRGTILLLFQPGEEGGGGGKFMVEEGVMKGVLAVHGIHVVPTHPTGTVSTKPGVMTAGADVFRINITGKGGHAAMPHLTNDPVLAAASVVTNLQQLVSRVSNPSGAPVISVTVFNTGKGATNVIPDQVSLVGTLRARTLEQLDTIRARIILVAENIASAHGCKAETRWMDPPYIPLINDEGVFGLVKEVTQKFGLKWRDMLEPVMAGEDFAFLAQASPGCFTYLGSRNESCGAIHSLHTGKFVLDETVLPRGAAFHAAMALAFLDRYHQGNDKEEL